MNHIYTLLSALFLLCSFKSDNPLQFKNVTYKRYLLDSTGSTCKDVFYDEIKFQDVDSMLSNIIYYRSGKKVVTSIFHKPLFESGDTAITRRSLALIFRSNGLIYSKPMVFKIGFREFTVYAQANYDCYDPRCGQRHGHVQTYYGTTWIMKEFGPVLILEEGKSVTILNHAGTVGHPPKALMEQLLVRAKVPAAISSDYLSGISDW